MIVHFFPPQRDDRLHASAENVPVELREPLYKDQYDQEHLKPAVSKLLVSPEIYCRAQALLAQTHGAPASAPASASPSDNCALLHFLTKKGVAPQVQDVDVTEDDLRCTPIKMVGLWAKVVKTLD